MTTKCLLLMVLLLSACGDDDGPAGGTDAGSDTGPPDAGPVLPPPVCGPGTLWAPGTAAFREVTGEWGLEGVEGTRLNVADVDGDGWADVLVRRGPALPDDFAPGGMRHTWLLRNTGARRFEDVTQASGLLTMRTNPGGTLGRPSEVAAFGDLDNDGDLDAYTGLSTADRAVSMEEHSEIMINDGHGVFTFGPEDSAVRRALGIDVPAGASFTDVDRDGLLDLWVPLHNYSTSAGSIVFMQDHLYRGDGTGFLTDITEASGMTTQDWRVIATINEGRAHTRAWAALACDLNGDGTPELLAASYGRAPNHLWQGVRAGDGTVTYTNRSVASGYAYDMDMTWQDNEFALCFCRDNPTAEGCAGLPAPRVTCSPNWNHDQDREPFRLGGNSAATSCADLDGDGDMDLLTGEIKHWWAGSGADGSEVLINSGEPDVRLDRPGDPALGLAIDHGGAASWDEGHMTNAIFDFDDDGRPDVYVGASDYAGNRGHLYHNAHTAADGLRFVELGIEDFFEHNRSHGVAVADFDRDGDLDVIVGHSRARCDPSGENDCYATMQVRLFENQLAGNFVQLKLVGAAGTNRAAIGARVTVVADGVTQTQEVGGGFGHYGAQHDMVLHFGLAAACEAEVTVRWPDAALTTETFTLPAGHRFRITQGAAAVAADP